MKITGLSKEEIEKGIINLYNCYEAEICIDKGDGGFSESISGIKKSRKDRRGKKGFSALF